MARQVDTRRGTPWRLLLKLHGLVTDIGYVLASIGIFSMCILYCMEVVARYFLRSPTTWSLETVTFIMLAVTFLAIPHAVRVGMHIAVTLLADLYPRQSSRIAFVMNLAGLLICSFVTYVSLSANVAQYQSLISTIGNVILPKWWLTSFITYGFASSALWYTRLLFTGGQPIPPVLSIVPRPEEELRV